jgi:prophage regulatory protein
MATTLHKINDVSKRFRLCPSQIYKMIQAGEFPPPIKPSKRSSVWTEEVLEAWLQSRIEQSQGKGV